MLKKIHIIGGAGSGKTYIAEQISNCLRIQKHDLDDIFWDNNANGYGVKSEEEVRDKKLNDILKNDSWIIEGVYYKWLYNSFEQADKIFVLKPAISLQDWRVITRFLKRKIGILPAKKKETLKGLVELIRWNHEYNKVKIDSILDFIKEFDNKTVVVKDNREILGYIE